MEGGKDRPTNKYLVALVIDSVIANNVPNVIEEQKEIADLHLKEALETLDNDEARGIVGALINFYGDIVLEDHRLKNLEADLSKTEDETIVQTVKNNVEVHYRHWNAEGSIENQEKAEKAMFKADANLENTLKTISNKSMVNIIFALIKNYGEVEAPRKTSEGIENDERIDELERYLQDVFPYNRNN